MTANYTIMELNRRKFISNTLKAAGSAALLSSPLAGFAFAPVTVGEVMDKFISEVKGAPFSDTVDTLKSGNRDILVTGIVTTMFATVDVIKKAIAMKANFIIAHETTYYNHQDKTDWLKDDEVYQYKEELLRTNNIAIWRNHDYIHTLRPDGVRTGVIEKLEWQKIAEPNQLICNLTNAMSLKQLITYVKQKLHIDTVRYVGNPDQSCKKVLLLPGAAGGTRQMQAIREFNPDVLVCGEIAEWETAEYVRDAMASGKKLSLVVLGHIPSEEPGSIFLAKWLTEKFPAIKTIFVPSGNSLSFM